MYEMLLIDYIHNVYGIEKGCKSLFLKDNPQIIPQNLHRYFKSNTKVNLKTGQLFKELTQNVNLKPIKK